jgi:cell wall-associated NlpC family hydrolase
VTNRALPVTFVADRIFAHRRRAEEVPLPGRFARRVPSPSGRSGPTATGRLLAAALIATAWAVVPLTAALADPPAIPSEQEVANSRADAAAHATDVGRAQARLAAADARLQQLGDETEAVIEAYNAARVRLDRATQTAAAATAELAGADQQVQQAQQDMSDFVAASYRSGGQLANVAALLSSGGPATYLQQAGALDIVSRRQQRAADLLANARIVRQLAERRAQRVLVSERDAAGAADAAKQRAEAAIAAQRRAVTDLTAQRQALQQQLTDAQARADTVARSREEGLARVKAAAEAAAQAAAATKAATEAQASAAARQPAAASTSAATLPPTSSAGAAVSGGSPGAGSASAQQGTVAVAYATAQLGKSYVWGAEGPSTFDCSGLTMRAWQSAGVNIDHWTGSQWLEGAPVTRSALRAGDLLFFATNTADPNTIHHVGLYLGNGMMIHAPQTGDVVKISSASRPDFIGAVRP